MGCSSSKAERRQSVMREVQRLVTSDEGIEQTVYLNVYSLMTSESKMGSLSREALEWLGHGVNHSGVVVFGEEWSFGGGCSDDDTGIFTVEPTTADGLFREAIELGTLKISRAHFDAILDDLRPDWKASSYHLMTHNCNCFSKALCEKLSPEIATKFPSWVNRVANNTSVIVPPFVVDALMDALNPPSASNPQLVNVIFLDAKGSEPKKTTLTKTKKSHKLRALTEKAEGRGCCKCLSSMNSATATLARQVHARLHQLEFDQAFPELSKNKERLLDVYGVTVRHLGRWQSARLFITDNGISFQGSNELLTTVPWTNFTSVVPALIDPDQRGKKSLPTFTFPAQEKCDTILLYGEAQYKQEWTDGTFTTETIEDVYFPILDFTSKGHAFKNSVGLLVEQQSEQSKKGLGVLHDALVIMFSAWGSKRRASPVGSRVGSRVGTPSNARRLSDAPHQPFFDPEKQGSEKLIAAPMPAHSTTTPDPPAK